MQRYRLALALALVLTVSFSPLSYAQAPEAAQASDPAAAKLQIDISQIKLEVGETATITATVTDADGNVIETPELIYFSMARRNVGIKDGVIEAYRPGEEMRIIAAVPHDGMNFRALRNPAAIAANPLIQMITVTVPTPPIADVTINDPPELFYSGTRVVLETTVTDASGAERTEAELTFDSSDASVARVSPSGTLSLLAPGNATIVAKAGDKTHSLPIEVMANGTASVELTASAEDARTGDVVRFWATARDANGGTLDSMPVQYAFQTRTINHELGDPGSGMITEDGRFVADEAGEYTIFAMAGAHTASMTIGVTNRDVKREIEILGQGAVRDRATSDLWVWEGPDGRDYAVTGTHNADGHAYFWDVTDPRNMQIIDTIRVDARTVNDVKVNEEGTIAVISREGASNRRNGLVILDVSDLQNKGAQILSRYDDELTGGVHNVFVYEDHVYALSAGQRYDIINIEDPTAPHRVGRFELDTPGHSIHDVWVTDGIAYSSNWLDGVVAVDIGGGDKGGTPRSPVMLGKTPYPNGWNHAAFPFRSKSTGKFYMIGGDEAGERGGTPGYDGEPPRMQGWIHIFEWDEWDNPTEVARYQVPEAGTHNVWVDEENEILYVAYYQGGLRVVDISGELLGDLYRQGREIAYFLPFDPDGFVPNAPFTWGPQPFKGNIFFADYHSGLWAVRLKPREGEEGVADGSRD